MNLGIYIHIPFCRKKCDYCSFYSIPIENKNKKKQEELLERYISKLLDEIEERSVEFQDYNVDTIYIGGGTPSLLDPLQVMRILNKIECSFRLNIDPEITIECNPEDITIEKMAEYTKIGINRAVLGIQTLNRELHNIIGRSSVLCDESLLEIFFNIEGITHCIDLIAGIPGETEEYLSSELDKICSYNPKHISLYLLSLESDTPLSNRISNSPDHEELQKKLLKNAIIELRDRNYIHYEVSNYALPSFESKHNLKYWKYMPYAGFGAGAHSFFSGRRFYHPSSIENYLKCKSPILIEDKRSRNAAMIEYILTGMRLLDGISMKEFEEKTSETIPKEIINRWEEMEEKGELIITYNKDDITIKFSSEGFFLMDNLIYTMVEMLL
ncbi:MAG: radical SAM family heme chaperone HemW [Spirochaetota bacterium]|nr:radical SAM family heme chaperone HemW [Spirochaetota bacterium]